MGPGPACCTAAMGNWATSREQRFEEERRVGRLAESWTAGIPGIGRIETVREETGLFRLAAHASSHRHGRSIWSYRMDAKFATSLARQLCSSSCTLPVAASTSGTCRRLEGNGLSSRLYHRVPTKLGRCTAHIFASPALLSVPLLPWAYGCNST